MSNSFPRTTRSLNLDGFGFSLTLLVLSIALILAWMVWFFQAPIAIYEISKDVSVQDDGMLLARFPTRALERMTPGQNVVVQIEGRLLNAENVQNGKENGEEQSLSARGILMKIVPPDSGSGNGEVEIFLTDEGASILLSQPSPAASARKLQAQVEIESITPFTIVQRAARQALTSTQMDTNPAAPGD